MCSFSSNASAGAPNRRFRSAVKASCSILRFRYLSRLEAYNWPLRLPPEGRVPLPYRLRHQGCHGHAQAPQKTAKSRGRTFEYSIGSGSHQSIAHHKAQDDQAAFLPAVSIDDAIDKAFDAARQRAEIDIGNRRPEGT